MDEDLDAYLPSIAAGDPEAFGRWVARAEDRVRGSLMSLAAHVDVEAVLQETLLRMWQVAPRVEPDGRPNALLRLAVRSARNLAISELRKAAVRPAVVADLERLPEPAVGPSGPDPLLRRVIAACRERLPGKPAQALRARLGDAGRPDRELAATLGMKINTFLQNITRARALLTECLRKHGVDLDQELA
ncbi:MAG: sigma-70 family RNA polymerase sigma factor [Myxococcales bacterium]|nr:sigma-70 family RNA polymerase sigma factor [Myxococcales bacterium]